MKIKKCFLAIALTVAMMTTMCVVATPVSAKTSYGVEHVRASDAYIAVTPGKTYTIYARSTDGHGVKFFDVIPEGNCVKIIKQGRRKGTRNGHLSGFHCETITFFGVSRSRKSSKIVPSDVGNEIILSSICFKML